MAAQSLPCTGRKRSLPKPWRLRENENGDVTPALPRGNEMAVYPPPPPCETGSKRPNEGKPMHILQPGRFAHVKEPFVGL